MRFSGVKNPSELQKKQISMKAREGHGEKEYLEF